MNIFDNIRGGDAPPALVVGLGGAAPSQSAGRPGGDHSRPGVGAVSGGAGPVEEGGHGAWRRTSNSAQFKEL